MKTITILFFYLVVSTTVFSQQFIKEWWKPIPGITAHSEAKAIMITDDNKLIIAGPIHKTWEFGNMFYVKTDTACNVIWVSYAEEQYDQWYQRPYRLMMDADGNINMIGTYPVVYYQGTYFTKLNSSGQLLNATLNGGQNDYVGGYDIEQTADGGYLVAAQLDDYFVGLCFALRKLNSDGQFVWEDAIEDTCGNHLEGAFYGMDKVNDSTFVLAGKRDFISGSFEDLDIIFAKIKVNNDSIEYLKFINYAGEYNDRGTDILTLPDDNGYIICGTGQNPNSTSFTVGIIMKIDTAGNILWRKTYSRSLTSNNDFIKIHLNADNDIIVLAQTNGGSLDVTLLKYSLDGELLQKTHFNNGGNEPVYDFEIGPDGAIYVLATTYNNMEIWPSVLKVNDICALTKPDVVLEDDQPAFGDDIIVHVLNTDVTLQYSLLQINGGVNLETYMGNGATLNFTVSGLNNEDVSQGIVVMVTETGGSCIIYSDTLYPVFVCPVDIPVVYLEEDTLAMGEDLIVNVLNTNINWEYSVVELSDNSTLTTSMGTGGDIVFEIPGLDNESGGSGIVVKVMDTEHDCFVFSDTLYPLFYCPVVPPEAFPLDDTPELGDDIIVRVLNTNTEWMYKLKLVNGDVVLDSVMGIGGNYDFVVAGLSVDDVSQGLVVYDYLPGYNNCFNYSDVMYITFTVGLKELRPGSPVLAPNPVHGILTLNDNISELTLLKVFGLDGKMVLKQKLVKGRNEIDVSLLPQGVYLFNIEYSNGNVVYRKIIKN
jgi:hypothetical protein